MELREEKETRAMWELKLELARHLNKSTCVWKYV